MFETPIDYPQEWKLSSLLDQKGGSHQQIDTLLDRLRKEIEEFDPAFPELLDPYQKLSALLEEAGAVILCLTSKDLTDTKATELEAKHTSIEAQLTSLNLKIDEALTQMTDEEFERVVEPLGDLGFPYRERRKHAKERMPLDKETLAADLAVPGYHANTTLYYTLIGSMEFTIDDKVYNIAQVENLLWGSDRDMREKALAVMEKTLTKYESLFAQVLNNIVDFRLRLYKNRKWQSYLHESLQKARMSKETLDAMWRVIEKNKPDLIRFVNAKAKCMGRDKLSWCDAMAPLSSGDEEKVSWEESCQEVLRQFERVSPKLAEFSTQALANGWVDAIESEKKRAGGFCVSMPHTGETRILLTYTGSPSSQATLAHELGHAYHAHVLYNRPYDLQHYPMNLAETASTMCEMIVSENAIRNAETPEKKLELLDHKLSQYLAYSMNLHSRFLFDSKLHEERANGFLAPGKLSEMMVDAQQTAYQNCLDNYFPHFWAYKMHFYFSDVPFYNWSYTFGFLFSLGLYHHLMKADNFEEVYDAILMDTGCMSVEELGKKHLAVDLTRDDFWQDALSTLKSDIDLFESLSQGNQ